LIDETPYPGPPYSPNVFDGGFPHGDQGKPHDFYHSQVGPWYELQRVRIRTKYKDVKVTYDWIMIDGPPEEASW
jgi:hypothetical protein